MSPIAGVILQWKLLTETIVSYFIPLIIASVVGALCSKIILREEFLFNFILKQNFDYKNVPFYIIVIIPRAFKKQKVPASVETKPTYDVAVIGGITDPCLFCIPSLIRRRI